MLCPRNSSLKDKGYEELYLSGRYGTIFAAYCRYSLATTTNEGRKRPTRDRREILHHD